MTHQADQPRRLRLLVGLFFWRDLEMEGGAGLIRSLVESAPPGVELRLVIPSPVAGLGLAPDAVAAYGSGSFLLTLLRYLAVLRREARRADLLVLLDNNPTFHLLTGPWLPGRPRAVVHLASPCIESSDGRNPQALVHGLAKSARLARWAGRLFGHPASRYVVSTEYQRRQLARLGFPAERVEVQPFGAPESVRQRRAGPGEGAERLVVGYLGHFSPVKGVPHLVRAVCGVLEKGLPIELRIAWSGKGGETKRVRRLLEECQRPDAIRLEGRVDVPSFLSGLDLVALPMRSESFPHPPLVLVEALTVGVPVVTSDAGGLPDLLAGGSFGASYPKDDVDALTRLLIALATDRAPLEEWRRRIAERAGSIYDTGAVWEIILGSAAARPAEVPA